MTLPQYWALATTLALLPLLAAVGYSAYNLEREINVQRSSTLQAERATDLGSTLGAQVSELVRTARQYALLKERGFLDLYEERYGLLGETAAQLKPLMSTGEARQLVDDIEASAGTVLTHLRKLPADTQGQITASLNAMQALSAQFEERQASERQGELRSADSELRDSVYQLLILVGASIPVSVLLIMLGSIVISRPIVQLSRAIGTMARNDFDTSVVIRGPSDLSNLGDNLEWMRRRIIAADEQKTAFVQHVTHELKTPLAGIIEAANLLSEGIPTPLDPGQAPIVAILLDNARNLQNQIQQLLNYSAVSHGISVQSHPTNLVDLCENIRANLEATNPSRSSNWHFRGRPDVITTDPRLVEMMLSNLLTNAFRYTAPGGSITVDWREGEGGGWHLEVSDTGRGVPEDEIDNIFDPFFSGANGNVGGTSRSGLGLAIVKKCVEALEGELQVISAPGEGTSFLFDFPGERAGPAA